MAVAAILSKRPTSITSLRSYFSESETVISKTLSRISKVKLVFVSSNSRFIINWLLIIPRLVYNKLLI